MPTNLCIDCKHHALRNYGHECHAPQNVFTSPVTGSIDYRIQFCNTMRSDELKPADNLCGFEGRWFEPTVASLFTQYPMLDETKAAGIP
jgi:hypothetical protein